MKATVLLVNSRRPSRVPALLANYPTTGPALAYNALALLSGQRFHGFAGNSRQLSFLLSFLHSLRIDGFHVLSLALPFSFFLETLHSAANGCHWPSWLAEEPVLPMTVSTSDGR